MEQELIPIDLTYFYSITGGDKDFEQKLLSGAITDIDLKVSGLRKNWESKDAHGVRESVHSLISLCAIAGMPTVEKWCRMLENSFVDGTFHEELALYAEKIIQGWPFAHSKLLEVVEGK